jgi:high-affinity iron transporter
MGAWFEMYSSWETLGAQLLAFVLVVGSYFAAERVRVKRPQKRAAAAAAPRGPAAATDL